MGLGEFFGFKRTEEEDPMEFIRQEISKITQEGLTVGIFSDKKEINWKGYRRQPVKLVNDKKFKHFYNTQDINFYYDSGSIFFDTKHARITGMKIFEGNEVIYTVKLDITTFVPEGGTLKFAKGNINLNLD